MRHVLFCLLLGFPLSAVWSPLQAHTIQGWSFWEQPDGTTFWGYVSGDEISVTYETADGYKFIPNSDDGYCYYAVVGESGEFRLSTARVGVDDPKAVSIVPGLERSAVRQAEINAERVRRGYSGSLPDRTSSGRPAAGKALLGAPATAPCTADDPCNLYVVLVTFVDETSGGSVFADYDMPYGYSGNDFRRLFYGDYEGVLPFTGTQTLTGGEQVDVFGSLRAYFHEVHGEDILRVQILNAEDENGLRWLPLPNTKHHYAGQSAFDFFEAAEDATIAPANQYDPATGAGFLHPIPTDFPTAASSLNTVLQNKVVYLYSGAVFTPGAQQASATPGVIQNSGIHPQANRITLSNPTTAGPNGDVGYQYVVGERQGFGWTDDAVDCFTGIGLHVHEIGHQFGFIHPDGLWHGNNPHTGLTADFDNANLLQWGAMQSGAHGPPLASGGYTIPYRSCPNPYNPIYRLDLGWNTVQDITTTAFNQRIEPGPAHIYRIPATATANGQMYILEHRSLGADASRGFGKYVSWHLLPTAPGLLLWRREPLNPASPPLLIFEPPPTLIPADQRSISDARPDGGANPSTEEWEDIPTDPFPGPDNVLHATDATGHLRHATRDEPGGGISASPDPGDSHIAIRNITNNTDHSVVDIYINYWAGPITAPTTWSGTVYVGGDVTIASGVTLTVDSGAEVRFLVNTDDTESGDDMDRSELIVEGVLVASDVTFRSANDEPSQNEWYGIHVESGGNATLTNVTIRDGMHCVSADDDNDLVLNNLSLANCGTPPTISGDQEPEFPERSEEVVETYMADDAEEDSVTWSLAEDPSDAFTINNNGELRFQDVPDFEALNAYDVTVRAEDSQQAVSDYPVTVEVINIEEAGTVTVSSPSDPPRVGEELTAQLEEDPDGVITGTERWTWQRQAPGTTGWPNITDATDAEYTPDTDDIGYLLQATVSYDDGQGTGKSAVSEPTAAVVGAPAAPEVKATAADARVVLTWQAAPANGLPVQYYETQYSADGGSNWSGFTEVDRKDTARETTVGGLTNDIEYTFEVRAVNEAGDGEEASTTATPHFVINEPENASVPFAEIPEGIEEWDPFVAEYTTNAAADTEVTWSVDEADVSPFTITETEGKGKLSFKADAAPDYETQPSYAVTVRAQVRAGTATASMASLAVTVEVTNEDDPGHIELSSWEPKVGDHLTATLTDQDEGVTWDTWYWQGVAALEGFALAEFVKAPPPQAESYPYTVQPSDVGKRIQVRVDYTDVYGPGKTASATTEVVVAANPHAPAIAGLDSVSINEGPTGNLGTYIATDADGDQVALTLTEADEGPFTLSGGGLALTSTGTLQATSALDYESKASYTVLLEATDDGEPPRSSTKPVTVTVSNVEEAGTVSLSSWEPKVGDHLTATLTDPDGGIGWTNWYWQGVAALEGFALAEFALEGFALAEFVKAPPQAASYPYTVQPSDVGKRIQVRVDYTDAHDSGKTASATTGVVVAANPHAPAIAGPDSVPINEGQTGSLGTYIATDADGDQVALTLTEADEGPFTLSWGALGLISTGTLQATSALDYESKASYTVLLEATDDGEPPRSSTKPVTVTVDDVNEPPPEPGAPSVQAAATNGHERLAVSWTAPSTSGRPPITDYDVQYQASTATDWSEHGVSGTATTTTIVELADSTTYQVQIRATNDEGTSGWSASGQGSTDDDPDDPDDPIPCSPDQPGSLSLSPDPPRVGELVTATVTDPDGGLDNVIGAIALSQTNQAASPKATNSTEAYVTSVLVPNSWSGETAYAYVQYSDNCGHGKTASTTSQPVVGPPPNQPPELSGDTSVSFAENGTGPVGTYTASDPEGSQLTWGLGDTDAGAFRWDDTTPTATTRTLYFQQAPDFESKSRYEVSVSVQDNASWVSLFVTVEVTNVNEPPQITTLGTGVDVPENTTYVATYAATDPDANDAITWSVSGANGSLFAIDAATGALTFLSAPDYEGGAPFYSVDVVATDEGGLSDEKGVIVSISDVNEPPPEPDPPSVQAAATNGHERLAVSWTAPSTSGRPAITDYDVQYRVSTAATWSGHGVSGTGTTTTIGGLSASTTYQVQIRATNDEGTGGWSASGSGSTDAPPNTAPVISGPDAVSVAENTTYVADYDATDAEGGTLSWATSGGFSINNNGSLSFSSAPDFESGTTTYSPTVTVTDNGGLSDTKYVTVTVTNEDDPGTVSLSSSEPQVGDHVTATLSDQDGGVGWDTWYWSAIAASEASGSEAEVQPRLESYRYTVQPSDVGKRLQARVDYTDAHGPDKSAESSQTSPVQAASGKRTETAKPVSLSALPDTVLAALAAPNPFNPTTTLHLQVPVAGWVSLTLYNLAGQVVRTLVDEYWHAGYHTLPWDGLDDGGYPVTSGLYLYRVRAGKQVIVHKMVLIR